MTRAAWLGLAAALVHLTFTWAMVFLAGLGMDPDQYDFVVHVLWAPWGALIDPPIGSLIAATQLGLVVYFVLRWRSRHSRS